MTVKHKNLTYTDRLILEKLIKSKQPVSTIAAMLGFHRSTIYRELKKGIYTALNYDLTEQQRYSADIAQQYHDFSQTSKGAPLKIGNNYHFINYIEHKILKDRYSPAAALHQYKNDFGIRPISINTLYSYIDQGMFLNITRCHLPDLYRHKHKNKKIRRAKRPPAGKSIEKRPPEVNDRLTFGHWEIDTIVGKREGKGQSMLVLTERLSRYEIIRKLPDSTSNSVILALDKIFFQYGNIFKTITSDNGTEFSDYHRIKHDINNKQRTEVYYAHPYSSYERGSNERQNRIIRRWFIKGSDFNNYTDADVQRVETWLNSYPRRLFNWCSSADKFHEALKLSG